MLAAGIEFNIITAKEMLAGGVVLKKKNTNIPSKCHFNCKHVLKNAWTGKDACLEVKKRRFFLDFHLANSMFSE